LWGKPCARQHKGGYFREFPTLNKTKERTPLTTEATRTLKMARFCKLVSSKASLAINIETVKPIPAELPVAKISRQLTFPDSVPTFAFIAKKVKAKIPIGFPTTSPAKIAQAIGEFIACCKLCEEITIPEFAKANNGTIRKAVQG